MQPYAQFTARFDLTIRTAHDSLCCSLQRGPWRRFSSLGSAGLVARHDLPLVRNYSHTSRLAVVRLPVPCAQVPCAAPTCGKRDSRPVSGKLGITSRTSALWPSRDQSFRNVTTRTEICAWYSYTKEHLRISTSFCGTSKNICTDMGLPVDVKVCVYADRAERTPWRLKYLWYMRHNFSSVDVYTVKARLAHIVVWPSLLTMCSWVRVLPLLSQARAFAHSRCFVASDARMEYRGGLKKWTESVQASTVFCQLFPGCRHSTCLSMSHFWIRSHQFPTISWLVSRAMDAHGAADGEVPRTQESCLLHVPR